MADYFTHFSCLIDVGTPDKAARALALFQELARRGSGRRRPGGRGLRSRAPGRARGQHPLDP